jgi:hypothetical protein
MAGVLTVDRFGHRKSLYFGFFIQGAVHLLWRLATCRRTASGSAAAYGIASAVYVFVYTFFFARTVLMITLIYPEI